LGSDGTQAGWSVNAERKSNGQSIIMRRVTGWFALSRVSCTGEVGVKRSVFTREVVSWIVKAAEALCWAVGSIFRRVIKDCVKNDFDAGPVQRLYHVSKFI